MFFQRLLFTIRFAFLSLAENVASFFRYGFSQRMLGVEIGLALLYPIISPYRINARYIRNQNDSTEFVFGETPLRTLEKICRWARIPQNAVIFDVGCGWGRTTFFLDALNRADRTIGIDIIPQYIRRANRLRSILGRERMDFVRADVRRIDYRDADVIYSYCTCFSEPVVEELVALWEDDLYTGTVVITTSYCLSNYAKKGRFRLLASRDFHFIWGLCRVFCHVLVDVAGDGEEDGLPITDEGR
ncbi:MAG: class I SAM-dependent methyltransferase [Myxococcota bacterium]|nr:class I SAM-dependent methyltransferase [Myxococcota bacterium]